MGWLRTSKRLAALPRTRGSTLAHGSNSLGCGKDHVGSGALPLARAAAVPTRFSPLEVHLRLRRYSCRITGNSNF